MSMSKKKRSQMDDKARVVVLANIICEKRKVRQDRTAEMDELCKILARRPDLLKLF